MGLNTYIKSLCFEAFIHFESNPPTKQVQATVAISLKVY